MDGDKTNLSLNDPQVVKCWLISFEGHCRTKQIADKIGADGSSPKTDKFLERVDPKALLKIISLLPGKNMETILFSEIKKAIMSYVEPQQRLVIAERTNFLQINQNDGETEADYLARLNDASTTCNWAELKTVDPINELIKTKFIAGLKDEALKLKILEKLQSNPSTSINQIVNICQMHRQIDVFVHKKATETCASASQAICETAFIRKNKFDGRKQANDNFNNRTRRNCWKCGIINLPRQCPESFQKCL